MAAKRSPILGYNHNVKYRGVVFHVQTEDSGLLNPHLFTHLFHEGVIVSTRKYVYDAGANEEAIKGLMQAQHKAVMKDLRKGAFDDKIDQYLSGTAGLEPRTSEVGVGQAAAHVRHSRAQTEESPPPDEVIAQAKAAMSISEGSPLEITSEGLSEPIELPRKPTEPNLPPPPMDDAPTLHGSSAADVAAAVAAANQGAADAAPTQARTKTAERTSKSQVRPTTPPAGVVTARAATPPAGVVTARAATPPPIPQRGSAPAFSRDSNPVIEITMEDDEVSGRHRGPRDTNVEAMEMTDGIPSPRGGTDAGVPNTVPVRQQSRPASHGAAALPPMKSPSRPSITPPVITRAVAERDDADLSAPVEIYQAAPPSVEPPPGERSERPGQYSVSRRDGQAPIREKTGRLAAVGKPEAIPAGLARPRPQSGSGSVPVVQQQPAAKDPASGRAVPTNVQREPTPSSQPQAARSPTGQPPPRPAMPPATPGRVPAPQQAGQQRVHVTAPIVNRTPSPAQPTGGSGVVMTRPAVIVGAPPKPAAAPSTQRVRKAREDEGRGFGQGLISEKSLDEVILAYLSEDAEEK